MVSLFTVAKLQSHTGRLAILAELGNRLADDDISDAVQRGLSACIRIVNSSAALEFKHRDEELIRQMKERLDADAAARAAMESGVQFVDEVPEPGTSPQLRGH